jgi:lycopene beta-cyclase
LLQHFKGWVIETAKPAFDPSQAIFMDFRVSQQNGTTFIYLMPTSSTTALVEYTLFTEKVLPQEIMKQVCGIIFRPV